MRGRANSEVVRLAKARKHAKRSYFCSCGKIVHGNGGKASHAAMHERKGEWRQRGGETGFTWISADTHRAKFPEQWK